MKNVRCAGYVLTGYWKGKLCGSNAVGYVNGQPYCATHAHTASNDPGRFEKARKSWDRKMEKRGAEMGKGANDV